MSDGALLDTLDRLPRLRQFDAFPKPMYLKRTSQGGLITVLLSLVMTVMAFVEIRSCLFTSPEFTFDVDNHIGNRMQLNIDITVATPCDKLAIDLRDASGDYVHFDDKDLVKDPTHFESERSRAESKGHHNQFYKLTHAQYRNQKKMPRKNKKSVRGGPRHKDSGFEVVEKSLDGDKARACRVYGSIMVKKVTANLHIKALVPLFMIANAGLDRDINMSHIIHEFSFGDYFPDIAEPLDLSMELTSDYAAVYQYFLSVVPTQYISGRRILNTNQYSVTDYKRDPRGQAAFPGLYFKYDIEPMTMTVRQRSKSLVSFLVRITSVLGGVWVCTNLLLRVLYRLKVLYRRYVRGASLNLANATTPNPSQYSNPYFSGPMDTSNVGGYDSYSASAPNYAAHAPSQTKYRTPNF